MPNLPAFCDTCGTVFASGFQFENSRHITLSGCTSGPCPRCGGSGHIPDGVYNFLDNTIEILSAPSRSIEELSRLLKIVRKAIDEKADLAKLTKQIRDENPAFQSITDVLPTNKLELYGFLPILIALIQMLINSFSKPAPPNVTINNVFNQVYSAPPPAPTPIEKKIPLRVNKTGRNELCPCGSKRKYKLCCGRTN